MQLLSFIGVFSDKGVHGRGLTFHLISHFLNEATQLADFVSFLSSAFCSFLVPDLLTLSNSVTEQYMFSLCQELLVFLLKLKSLVTKTALALTGWSVWSTDLEKVKLCKSSS